MTRLSITRGDTRVFTITLTDADEEALDLTGMSVTFTAKRTRFDSDEDAVIAKSIGSGIVVDEPTSGVALMTLDPEDTEALPARTHRLYYDVQVVDVLGVVVTPLADIVEIRPDVTQDTTAPGS
jgi:hypothetical protein